MRTSGRFGRRIWWYLLTVAARGRQRPAWLNGLWVWLAFTAYYWGSALFLVCKAGLEG